MTKKSNFIPYALKVVSNISCILIMTNAIINNHLVRSSDTIMPIIYIENFILRMCTATVLLTVIGYCILKLVTLSSKKVIALFEKYLSLIFFFSGILLLLFPTNILWIADTFSISAFLMLSYTFSVRIYKNKEYNSYLSKKIVKN